MSISIKTIDYIKTKDVEIDGRLFKMRPMSSAESLRLSSISRMLSEMNDTKTATAEKVMPAIEEMENIFFGLWDNEEAVRSLLKGLNVDALFNIYHDVAESSING